jgi:hypothetical protein
MSELADPNVTILEEPGTTPEPVEPSAAPDSATPDPGDTSESSGYQFQDPEVKELFDQLGEDGIKNIAYAQAMQAQKEEAEKQRTQQQNFEKALVEQQDAVDEAIEDEYQKILRKEVRKARPPDNAAFEALQARAWKRAERNVDAQIRREETAQMVGQYLQQANQAAYEKQQIYAQRPDLVRHSSYIDDLVDRQGFPAQAVISRLDETINHLKSVGMYSDAAPAPDYPTHQGLRQMGPVSGKGHLSVVGEIDTKAEDKDVDAMVDKLLSL